jgi:hypothetical protein
MARDFTVTPDNLTPYADAALPLLTPFLGEFDGLGQAVAMDELGDELRFLARGLVRDAVAAGCTWEQVGAAFGISRQSAHERFNRR